MCSRLGHDRRDDGEHDSLEVLEDPVRQMGDHENDVTPIALRKRLSIVNGDRRQIGLASAAATAALSALIPQGVPSPLITDGAKLRSQPPAIGSDARLL